MSKLPEKMVEICVVGGVEGPSIYIDDFRMAGNKPWGGGQIIYKWQVKLADFACVPILAKQIADQQAEVKEMKEILVDNPVQSDMDAAQFTLNLLRTQLTNKQALIKKLVGLVQRTKDILEKTYAELPKGIYWRSFIKEYNTVLAAAKKLEL